MVQSSAVLKCTSFAPEGDPTSEFASFEDSLQPCRPNAAIAVTNASSRTVPSRIGNRARRDVHLPYSPGIRSIMTSPVAAILLYLEIPAIPTNSLRQLRRLDGRNPLRYILA